MGAPCRQDKIVPPRLDFIRPLPGAISQDSAGFWPGPTFHPPMPTAPTGHHPICLRPPGLIPLCLLVPILLLL